MNDPDPGPAQRRVHVGLRPLPWIHARRGRTGRLRTARGNRRLSKGKNGLELEYDTLLHGQVGYNSVMRVGGRWTNVIAQEPVDLTTAFA